jgi:hypothetical protein
MFQPHSFLWNYLWVAPNLLLGVLALILWRRGLVREFRSFFLYALFQFVEWAILYPVDLIKSVPGVYYWAVYWIGVPIEFVLVFLLISDIYADVFGSYEALAKVAKLMIRWGAGLLIISAAVVAGFAPFDNPNWIIPACHILQESMYVVVCGLLVLLFGTASYFKLTWSHRTFGIALGLGISASIHLATWAIMANGGLVEKRNMLDMINLGTFHVAVVIWFYYLLAPHAVVAKPPLPLPENNLAVWNRELERLLHK